MLSLSISPDKTLQKKQDRTSGLHTASEKQNRSNFNYRERMKVVIQPCSDKISAANLEKTIFKSVATKKILEFIPDHNTEQFARSFPNQANLWGVTNGSNNRNLKKWEKINDGDKILLYRNKKLFLSGTIGFKIKLQNLARELWGAKDEEAPGRTFTSSKISEKKISQ